MTQDTTTTTIGQPFEELDVYTFHVDGVEYHVEIDQEIDHALRTYITTRYPATIRRIYLDPLGLPGGEYARGDDHLCVPTIEIIYHIPDDAEHAHLDGKRQRVLDLLIDLDVVLDPVDVERVHIEFLKRLSDRRRRRVLGHTHLSVRGICPYTLGGVSGGKRRCRCSATPV